MLTILCCSKTMIPSLYSRLPVCYQMNESHQVITKNCESYMKKKIILYDKTFQENANTISQERVTFLMNFICGPLPLLI